MTLYSSPPRSIARLLLLGLGLTCSVTDSTNKYTIELQENGTTIKKKKYTVAKHGGLKFHELMARIGKKYIVLNPNRHLPSGNTKDNTLLDIYGDKNVNLIIPVEEKIITLQLDDPNGKNVKKIPYFITTKEAQELTFHKLMYVIKNKRELNDYFLIKPNSKIPSGFTEDNTLSEIYQGIPNHSTLKILVQKGKEISYFDVKSNGNKETKKLEAAPLNPFYKAFTTSLSLFCDNEGNKINDLETIKELLLDASDNQKIIPYKLSEDFIIPYQTLSSSSRDIEIKNSLETTYDHVSQELKKRHKNPLLLENEILIYIEGNPVTDSNKSTKIKRADVQGLFGNPKKDFNIEIKRKPITINLEGMVTGTITDLHRGKTYEDLCTKIKTLNAAFKPKKHLVSVKGSNAAIIEPSNYDIYKTRELYMLRGIQDNVTLYIEDPSIPLTISNPKGGVQKENNNELKQSFVKTSLAWEKQKNDFDEFKEAIIQAFGKSNIGFGAESLQKIYRIKNGNKEEMTKIADLKPNDHLEIEIKSYTIEDDALKAAVPYQRNDTIAEFLQNMKAQLKEGREIEDYENKDFTWEGKEEDLLHKHWRYICDKGLKRKRMSLSLTPPLGASEEIKIYIDAGKTVEELKKEILTEYDIKKYKITADQLILKKGDTILQDTDYIHWSSREDYTLQLKLEVDVNLFSENQGKKTIYLYSGKKIKDLLDELQNGTKAAEKPYTDKTKAILRYTNSSKENQKEIVKKDLEETFNKVIGFIDCSQPISYRRGLHLRVMHRETPIEIDIDLESVSWSSLSDIVYENTFSHTKLTNDDIYIEKNGKKIKELLDGTHPWERDGSLKIQGKWRLIKINHPGDEKITGQFNTLMSIQEFLDTIKRECDQKGLTFSHYQSIMCDGTNVIPGPGDMTQYGLNERSNISLYKEKQTDEVKNMTFKLSFKDIAGTKQEVNIMATNQDTLTQVKDIIKEKGILAPHLYTLSIGEKKLTDEQQKLGTLGNLTTRGLSIQLKKFPLKIIFENEPFTLSVDAFTSMKHALEKSAIKEKYPSLDFGHYTFLVQGKKEDIRHEYAKDLNPDLDIHMQCTRGSIEIPITYKEKNYQVPIDLEHQNTPEEIRLQIASHLSHHNPNDRIEPSRIDVPNLPNNLSPFTPAIKNNTPLAINLTDADPGNNNTTPENQPPPQRDDLPGDPQNQNRSNSKGLTTIVIIGALSAIIAVVFYKVFAQKKQPAGTVDPNQAPKSKNKK